MTSQDRIEKQIVLNAPIARVWHAIADSREFGIWFGVRLHQPFAPGRQITGKFEGDFDEAKIRDYQASLGIEPTGIRPPTPNYVFCTVERMEEPHLFSFRWIPYGIDIESDPETETPTLVEFRLEPEGAGTRLTIVESGFEKVPEHRRQRAFMMNSGGWSAQIENVKRHVEQG